MRDFSTFLPRFWTTGPGKKLRGDPEAQLIAAYLFTCPSSNHLGLYYLPISTIAHDIGLSLEGASKGLRRVLEGGFGVYDDASEHVFIWEMAQIQILGKKKILDINDNKLKGVHNEIEKYSENPLLDMFFDRYGEAFSLGSNKPLASPLQAPPKGCGGGPLKRQETRDKRQETYTGDDEPLADLPLSAPPWLQIAAHWEKTSDQIIEAYQHKNSFESVARQASKADSKEPIEAAKRAIDACWSDPFVQGKRPSPAFLARHFGKYCQKTESTASEPVLSNDEAWRQKYSDPEAMEKHSRELEERAAKAREANAK